MSRSVSAPRAVSGDALPSTFGSARAGLSPKWLLLGGWLLAGVMLLAVAGVPPLDRTQEARVLETAREMLGNGVHGWMIPRLNGALRLQKPPLAYWMAAGSYKIFGVSEWAGRVPFVIMGWLAVGLTYAFARHLFGSRRVGALAAATLLGGMLLARHISLAETDIPVLLFTEMAAYAFWRAFEAGRRDRARRAGWLHAGFAAVGLTAMAKGLPFAFPLLFLLALVAVERRWRLLGSVLATGAPLTALAVAVPWYAYVVATEGRATLLFEMRAATLGEGHKGSVLTYVHALAVGAAPWAIALGAAIALAASRRRHRRDGRVRVLLLWAAAVLVPLCLAGQKQKHYLLPALPPLMILTGWYLDRVIRALAARRVLPGVRTGAAVIFATAVLCTAAAPALVPSGRVIRGWFHAADFAAAVLLLVPSLIAILLVRRNRVTAAAYVLAGTSAVAVPLLMNLWAPTLERISARNVADAARRHFGDNRSYVFYRSYALAVGFGLRSVVPLARTEEELEAAVRRDPRIVMIVRDSDPAKSKDLPPGVTARLTFDTSDGTVRFCEFAGHDPGVIAGAKDAGPAGGASAAGSRASQ